MWKKAVLAAEKASSWWLVNVTKETEQDRREISGSIDSEVTHPLLLYVTFHLTWLILTLIIPVKANDFECFVVVVDYTILSDQFKGIGKQ